MPMPWEIIAQITSAIILVLLTFYGQKYRYIKKFISELDDAIEDDKITADEAKNLAKILRKIF